MVGEGAAELVGVQHGGFIVGRGFRAGDAELGRGFGYQVAAAKPGDEVEDEGVGREGDSRVWGSDIAATEAVGEVHAGSLGGAHRSGVAAMEFDVLADGAGRNAGRVTGQAGTGALR